MQIRATQQWLNRAVGWLDAACAAVIPVWEARAKDFTDQVPMLHESLKSFLSRWQPYAGKTTSMDADNGVGNPGFPLTEDLTPLSTLVKPGRSQLASLRWGRAGLSSCRNALKTSVPIWRA